MKKNKLSLLLAIVLMFSSFSAAATMTTTFSFDCITNNNYIDATSAETSLFVDVIGDDNLQDQITFTFRNLDTAIQSSIAEIYFDTDMLLETLQIVNNENVEFQNEHVSPGNLPGASNITPEFVATKALSIEPENPAPVNGVNPGEEVSVVYSIASTDSYGDVIGQIQDGSLRIGIHVIDFESGGSESFVNEVPEPATIAILGMGMLFLKRRKTA